MVQNQGMRSPAGPSKWPSDQPHFYEIRVEGILDTKWTRWFEGFSLRHENGQTILAGWVADQSALYGVFNQLFDLGLPLISVERGRKQE